MPALNNQTSGVIDSEQLRIGTLKEMNEHKLPLQEGLKIATDHLRENPAYYSILEKAGL